MLASVDHRFVLLCNPKTGSTALEKAYRRHANFDVGRGTPWKHMSWRTYREVFGDYFDRCGCETYAVIRDPVDLLVSWWRFRQRPKIQNPRHRHHVNSTVGVPFDQWIQEWASQSPPSRARILEQRDVLMDETGAPAPITFVCHDVIDELAARLNRRIGVEVELERANESPDVPVEVDRESIERLEALRPHLDFYRRARDSAIGGSGTLHR